MTPDIACDQPLEDVEALIRLAGDYVQPSEDLRPRVLEAARAARRDEQVRRRIYQLAAVFLLAACGLASLGEQKSPREMQASWLPHAGAGSVAESGRDDAGWETVESFTRLRRQQARLLRLAL